MTAVERFRRLLREMTPLEKVVYAADFACAFAFGLLISRSIPKEGYANIGEIAAPLGDNPLENPFVIAILAIPAVAGASMTAGVIFVIVRSLHRKSALERFVMKLLVFALPGVGAGYIASIVLGLLGAHETPPGFFIVWPFAAAGYVAAAVAGFAAMLWEPEDRPAPRAANDDRAATAGPTLNESGSEPGTRSQRLRSDELRAGSQTTTTDKVVYAIFNAFAFLVGLLLPLFVPKEEDGAYHPLADLLGNNPFALAIALVLAAGASAATGFFAVRLVRRHSLVQRVQVKWFILFLPPLAAGLVAAMALGAVGAYELTPNFFAFLAVAAASHAFAGISGMAALRSGPEYDRVLKRLIARPGRMFTE